MSRQIINNVKQWLSVAGIATITLCAGNAGARHEHHRHEHPGHHHGRFRHLSGTLTTHQVDCPSLCTQGDLTGGLAGVLDFEMGSMEATEVPDVSYYEGINVITTENGTLSGPDYGYWNLVTGEFVDFTVFTEGTGEFEGVRGTLVITGVFDPVAGVGSSNYFAKLY